MTYLFLQDKCSTQLNGKQLFSYTLCRPSVDVLRSCLELFANLPTPQHWSLKPSVLTVSLQCKTGKEKKKGTIGPLPGTFTGSVELSYTPTITILCRSLFLNLLAIYLAISASPVILFCPLSLCPPLLLSHSHSALYFQKL